MAGRAVTVAGILLATVIAVGTWLYVQGAAPPYPWNMRAFQGLLLLCTLFALLFGRSRGAKTADGDDKRDTGMP
jgi:hypothetical protein